MAAVEALAAVAQAAASEAAALAEAVSADIAVAVDLAGDLVRVDLADRIIHPIITVLTDISGAPVGAGAGDRDVGITVPADV